MFIYWRHKNNDFISLQSELIIFNNSPVFCLTQMLSADDAYTHAVGRLF